jgi:hypothetical protein
MADVVDLIVADHVRIREMFAGLDRLLADPDPAGTLLSPFPAWEALAALMGSHLAAEEEICRLVVPGRSPAAGQAAAAAFDIREAVSEARLHAPGSPLWRLAVRAARTAADRHITGLEAGALARFRRRLSPHDRHLLACQWQEFVTARASDGARPRVPVAR